METHTFAQYTYTVLASCSRRWFPVSIRFFFTKPSKNGGEIVTPAVMAWNPIDCQAQIRDSGRCTRDFSLAPLTTKFSIARRALLEFCQCQQTLAIESLQILFWRWTFPNFSKELPKFSTLSERTIKSKDYSGRSLASLSRCQHTSLDFRNCRNILGFASL